MNTAEHYINTFLHTKCCVILLFVLSLIPYKTFAADVCVSDDTVAVIARQNWNWSEIDAGAFVPPSGNGSIIWKVSKDGVFIQGTSACLSSAHGVAQFGAYTDNNGILIDNNKIVVGGERNGKTCWCKITYPIASIWAMRDDSSWSSLNTCATNCAYWCLWNEITNILLRHITD